MLRAARDQPVDRVLRIGVSDRHAGEQHPVRRELLNEAAYPASRIALEPLQEANNATLEILIWTAERVEYAEAAARGLAVSSITGLEGGFCLLADYSQGLWSPDALAEENPFGTPGFNGSILES